MAIDRRDGDARASPRPRITEAASHRERRRGDDDDDDGGAGL